MSMPDDPMAMSSECRRIMEEWRLPTGADPKVGKLYLKEHPHAIEVILIDDQMQRHHIATLDNKDNIMSLYELNCFVEDFNLQNYRMAAMGHNLSEIRFSIEGLSRDNLEKSGYDPEQIATITSVFSDILKKARRRHEAQEIEREKTHQKSLEETREEMKRSGSLYKLELTAREPDVFFDPKYLYVKTVGNYVVIGFFKRDPEYLEKGFSNDDDQFYIDDNDQNPPLLIATYQNSDDYQAIVNFIREYNELIDDPKKTDKEKKEAVKELLSDYGLQVKASAKERIRRVKGKKSQEAREYEGQKALLRMHAIGIDKYRLRSKEKKYLKILRQAMYDQSKLLKDEVSETVRIFEE